MRDNTGAVKMHHAPILLIGYKDKVNMPKYKILSVIFLFIAYYPLSIVTLGLFPVFFFQKVRK